MIGAEKRPARNLSAVRGTPFEAVSEQKGEHKVQAVRI